MTNAIYINKVIYERLTTHQYIALNCPNKVFPLVAEQTTTFPFVVYWRENIVSESCKDGMHEDYVTFTVVAVSDNYPASLDLANAIRESLESMRFVSRGMLITNCKVTGVEESFQDNAFVQTLSFACKVNNND